MKNALNGINFRVNSTEKQISELEEIVLEIIQDETEGKELETKNTDHHY